MGAETEQQSAGIVGREDILVPSWAEHLHVGDRVRFVTPEGVLEHRVVGFSERQDMYGYPAVELPTEIEEAFERDVDVLVLREQDLVEEADR